MAGRASLRRVSRVSVKMCRFIFSMTYDVKVDPVAPIFPLTRVSTLAPQLGQQSTPFTCLSHIPGYQPRIVFVLAGRRRRRLAKRLYRYSGP